MIYPAPLVLGSTIALSAFSSGVPEAIHPRLDLVITDFRRRGFKIIEGSCLREDQLHVSASKELRAQELMDFLLDDSIAAIAPPWGGELAMEVLDLLDYEKISRATPKWIFGFSDVSTLSVVISARCGWASAHCANFIDLSINQCDPLTANTLKHLASTTGTSFIQLSSEKYQLEFGDFEDDPKHCLSLTEPTAWLCLHPRTTAVSFSGRLIGGCLGTILHLFGCCYLDIDTLQQRFADKGMILYFENAQMSPCELIRALLNLRFKGLFSHLNGILIGRSSAPQIDSAGLSYLQALQSVLAQCDCPVLYNVDIGHMPPNMTLINGAYAEVEWNYPKAKIEQFLI
ncbi:MAG: hypothetical protein OFPI_17980 [Osedax symbiont Rs2]|nr:MAG: hypothetical protein OFPI_17980 [Osedax symbiont Rs2]